MLLNYAKTCLLAALAFCLSTVWFEGGINPYVLDILLKVGINITLAVSLNLINGHTGQFSLGHGGFMAIGAYTAAAMTMFIGPRFLPTGEGMGVTLATQSWFLVSLLSAGLIAAIAGVLVGAPSLRLRGDYLAIVTLGFGEIIRVVFRNVESLGGALGLNGIPPYTNLFWTFGLAAVTVFTITTLVNSTYGRGFIAVHDDEVAASAMGLSTTRYKIVAFVIGAFFAGMAGGLYGHYTQTIDPKGFDFMKSIEIVVMVILGGMGNTAGVILAAVVLTLLPEGLRIASGWNLPWFGGESLSLRWVADTRMILYSLLLIVLMLSRPQGLFTWRRRAVSSRFSN